MKIQTTLIIIVYLLDRLEQTTDIANTANTGKVVGKINLSYPAGENRILENRVPVS